METYSRVILKASHEMYGITISQTQREPGTGRKRWPQICASGHLINFLSALSVFGSSHQIYLEKMFSHKETFESCLA